MKSGLEADDDAEVRFVEKCGTGLYAIVLQVADSKLHEVNWRRTGWTPSAKSFEVSLRSTSTPL